MKKNISVRLSIVLLLCSVFFITYYFFNPSGKYNMYFPKCPIKTFTGLYCTGCGSQRAIHQLFHFNFSEALKYNAIIVILLPLLILLIFNLLYNFIFQTKKRIKILYNNYFVAGLFIFLLLFTILRNLPFYPFNLLAPK